MPNYVSNVVKSDDEAVEIIREKYCNQNGALDFNKIIPMPKSLDITDGSVADLELRLVLTALDPARPWYRPKNLPKDTHRFSYTYQLFITTHLTTLCREPLRPFTKKEFKEASKKFDLYGETYEQALANGIIRVANIEAFGHSTWYGWRRDKWGTKWDAWGGGENGGEFYFDTAWNTPEPVIKRLSELMPGHKIIVLYADEGTGYHCGSYSYLNGEMVDSHLPEGGSKEAYEFCFENNFADKEIYRYDSEKGTYKEVD